jgi:hypothetical protein
MISMRKSDVCLQMQLTQPTRPLASVVRVALGPIAVREKGRLHAGGSDVLSAMLRLNFRAYQLRSAALDRVHSPRSQTSWCQNGDATLSMIACDRAKASLVVNTTPLHNVPISPSPPRQ